MKKILAAIAMLLAVVPFVGAKALNETTNYYNYKKGQIVNFYRNQESEAAHKGEANETIILDNKDTSNKFVKVWLLGAFRASNENPYELFPERVPFVDMVTVDDTQRTSLINTLTQEGYQDGGEADDTNYVYTLTDKNKGANLISLEELKDVFDVEEITATNTLNIKEYRINNKTLLDRDEKEFSLYKEFEKLTKVADTAKLQGIKNGIWTSTVAKETADEVYVYVVKFIFDANQNITDVKIVPVVADTDPSSSRDELYAFVPVVWANKTADCHQEPTINEYCYKCKKTEEGQFEWIILKENDSRVGDICEIAEDQKKCNPNTGSKSHLLEFSIVAALCAISLLVVRRKDLFRTI